MCVLTAISTAKSGLGANIMKSLHIAAAAACVFLGMSASSAHAVSFNLVGGSSGTIPDDPGENDLLGPLGLGLSLDGFFGAQVELTGPGIVTAEFLGFEAGFSNAFVFGPGFTTECTGCGSNLDTDPGEAPFDVLSPSGVLLFSFSTNGNGGDTVTNGGNPDNSGVGINFFASIVGNPTSRTGQSLLLFFDDDGANNDDNHDDMVIRLSVTAVPLPAAVWMMLAALGGLGYVARRKRFATA